MSGRTDQGEEDIRSAFARAAGDIAARPDYRDRLFERLSHAQGRAAWAAPRVWALRVAAAALAAIVIALIIAIPLYSPGNPSVGQAVLESGTATVKRDGELLKLIPRTTTLDLTAGSTFNLREGDELHTSPDSKVTAALDELGELTILGETSLLLRAPSGERAAGGSEAAVELSEGLVHVDAAPREGLVFAVKTPLVEATAEGTAFDIWVLGASRTVVFVEEGTVQVESLAQSAALTKGAQINVEIGEPPIVTDSLENLSVPEGGIAKFLALPPSEREDEVFVGVLEPLPEGSYFDSRSATFSWIPDFTQAGSYPLTLLLCREGRCAERVLELKVTDTNRPPEMERLDDPTIQLGETLRVALSATDPDGDEITFLIEGSQPRGALLDADSGVFRWTPRPDQAGEWSLRFAACDPLPLCDAQTVLISVEP